MGRAQERARIADLIRQAQDGVAGHLLLVGEAGIGKTALLDDATRVAVTGGMRGVRAVATVAERDLPGAGISLLAASLDDAISRLPTGSQEVLRQTARGIVPAATGGVVLELLATASETHPLLVCLDDIHWCDRASLRALTFASRRLVHDEVAVVFAGRPECVLEPSLAGLPRLEVGRLSGEEGIALLAEVAADVPADVARQLVEQLAGNPLALLETVRRLPPRARRAAAVMPDPLPVGAEVARQWAADVAGLPDRAQRALAVLAVDDSGAPDALARAWSTLGVGAPDLLPAERHGVVRRREGRWQFRHPLARHACAAALPAATVRRAHGAIAAAFPGSNNGTADHSLRRMWHRIAATPGPDPALAAEARSTAHDLAQSGAASTASLMLERAADLVPSPHDRADLLAEAAAQALLDEDDERAIALAEHGLDLDPDDVTRGRLLRARGLAVGRTRAPVEGRAHITEALELLPERERRDALLDLLFSTELTADASVVMSRVLDQIGDPRDYDAFDRLTIGEAAFTLARISAADLAVLWCEVDPTTGPLGGIRTETYFNAGLDIGLDVAAEGWSRLDARLHAIGGPHQRLESLAMARFLDFYEGRWDQLLDDVDESTSLSLALGRADLYGDAMRASVLARRDDAEAFESTVAAAERVWGEAEMAFGAGVFTGERGLHLLTQGRPEEAAPLLERSARAATPSISAHTFVADHSVTWVETLVDLARTGEACDALEWVDSRFGESQATLGRGFRTRAHAALAAPAEAEALYLSAIEDITRGPHVFEAARTRLRYATWLRRRRRKKPAAEQATIALATFESLRCGAWAQRCRDELAAAGVDQVRGGHHDARRDLTAQERRVAAAVAAGLSNRETGQRLFLSPRTVEVHLGHVYRKLGLRGRADLVRWWSERGQPAPALLGHEASVP